jgi:hypothetical protein
MMCEGEGVSEESDYFKRLRRRRMKSSSSSCGEPDGGVGLNKSD